MKKVFGVLLASIMLFANASADINLSGMTYQELVELKDRINLAMWNSQEWQEVIVPQGLWKVGEDIPSGTWDVLCATDDYAEVYYGDTVAEDGVSIKITTRFYHEELVSPNYRHYEVGKDRDRLTISVRDGDCIVIDRSSVVFTPSIGKPDLGFK